MTTPNGEVVDVHEGAGRSRGVVLLLHGSGARERDVLRPLAEAIAAHGQVVVVPDWVPESDDWPHHLTDALGVARSVARRGRNGRLTLAGWSSGASGALWLARHDPSRLRRIVLLGSSGRPLPGFDPLEQGSGCTTVEVSVVVGRTDDVVPPDAVRAAGRRLRALGHDVTVHEVDGDHAGLVMTEYDHAARRCRPSEDPTVHAAGATTAAIVAGA